MSRNRSRKPPKVVLVTGTRFCGSEGEYKVRRALKGVSPTKVIVGCCAGVDDVARRWAQENKIEVRVFFADWAKHGLRAGPIRNQQMVDEKPDLCLAFPTPQSRGTRNCLQLAVESGIPTRILELGENR